MDNIVNEQQHTVICDNSNCDYKVVNNTGEVDLEDLKNSIEQDGKSHNIELLSSLLESARDTIKEKSIIIHQLAKEKM